MTADERLGVCPNCGHGIRSVDELISYERSDDTHGVYAKCPFCGAVVAPE
jgi:uncharacterized Zn finger protein